MSDQDKILSFLRIIGPVLPAQIAKHINSNILLASALLAELSSQGKIKISHLKIGGSPLYYLPEHKEKLQQFLHDLNSKDQQTFNLLKEKKILKEKNLDLLSRVSLRNIKDFATPLNVTINQNKELFWKWFLLTDDEAIELIKSQLTFQPKLEPRTQGLETKPQARLETKLSSEGEKGLEKPKSPPRYEEKQIETKQIETELEEKPRKPLFQKIKEKLKPKLSSESEKWSATVHPRRKGVPDDFFPKIDFFFQERNIKIETKETLRKNSEMDFIVKAPSILGKITYFCKAKNKKRCDEKDLSAAYLVAQSKKLPLLFLYTNELSKKAQEMLDSKIFENLVVKRIE